MTTASIAETDLFQRTAAEHAVRHVRGVLGVQNQIVIAPKAVERDVRHRIVEALHRNADIDAPSS